MYIQLRKNPRVSWVISLYMKQKLFSMSQGSNLTTLQPDNLTTWQPDNLTIWQPDTFEYRHENKTCSACPKDQTWQLDTFEHRHENKSCSACLERVNERVKEWKSERVREWKSERVKEWKSERVIWFPAFVWRSDIFTWEPALWLVQSQERVRVSKETHF